MGLRRDSARPYLKCLERRRRDRKCTRTVPLTPYPEVPLEDCLTCRYREVFDRLTDALGDEDAAAAGAVAAFEEGSRLLKDGSAATMTPEQRAGLLWIVAIRAARQYLRWQRTRWTHSTILAEPTVAADHPDADRIQAALSMLPEEYQLPVQLFFFDHLSLGEIGRAMGGVTRSSIRCRIHTALRRLKKMLSF